MRSADGVTCVYTYICFLLKNKRQEIHTEFWLGTLMEISYLENGNEVEGLH